MQGKEPDMGGYLLHAMMRSGTGVEDNISGRGLRNTQIRQEEMIKTDTWR